MILESLSPDEAARRNQGVQTRVLTYGNRASITQDRSAAGDSERPAGAFNRLSQQGWTEASHPNLLEQDGGWGVRRQ